MNAAQRRLKIKQLLAETTQPVSANRLAAACGVSRQIIVGDIALLRAAGMGILATPRGYVPEEAAPTDYTECSVACQHDSGRVREELYLVVDLGGGIIDVTVEHPIYGQLCGQLHVFSRFDADEFCRKSEQSLAQPLSQLTGGAHLHRIRAKDQQTLVRIIGALREHGFLLEE